MSDLKKDFLSLAKLCLEGRNDESLIFFSRALNEIIKKHPGFSEELEKLMKKTSSPLRNKSLLHTYDPLPVDQDSRLELVKQDVNIFFEFEPVWTDSIRKSIETVIEEKKREGELLRFGLQPTKSMLFVGPPGVGKTISAKWIAMKLQCPLVVLDLAAVMSSFLGKTGNNIRSVLDFAKKKPSVLLLDEFDTIAKKRDDPGEVGELKRLVNVLLQAIDEWPSSGLLIAATNHPSLLDPAVWRRFDNVLEFSMPKSNELEKYIHSFLQAFKHPIEKYAPLLSIALEGYSFAEVEKKLNQIIRNSIIHHTNLNSSFDNFLSSLIKECELERRLEIALTLEKQGYSQRDIHDITSCSRDTLREHGIATKNSKKTIAFTRI